MKAFRSDVMLPDDTFEGKTALITGGGTGLGFEVARFLGRCGARVILASRNEEHLQTAAKKLQQERLSVHTVVTDVRRPASVAGMLQAAVEWSGGVDILVNNAAGNFLVPSRDLSPGGWKVVIDIALNGVFYCTREVGLHMMQRGGGRIINVVAAYAWTGGPGTVHSAAAKAGVVALTRTLAVEWAKEGIRINAVCPGAFDSEGARQRLWPTPEAAEALRRSIPQERFAELGEVANAVAYLASPWADYINGEVLVVDAATHLGRGIDALGSGPPAEPGGGSRR
jgi:NAD(P)-dependent dehydrogenase (short-subunit alcohol dehydrogenase family)